MRALPRSLRLPAAGAGTVLVVLLLVVSGLADVAVPPAGVLMKKLAANLSFGAGAEPAPPRPTVPLDAYGYDAFGGFDPAPGAGSSFFPPLAPSACPEASDSDFPERPAGFDVEGLQEPGRYRWKQRGTAQIPPLPAFSLPAFTERRIEHVQPGANGGFTYDFVIPSIFGREVDTIAVVPGSGISVTKIVLATGSSTVTFSPLQPVTLLPLPVTVGAPVGGTVVAIDPQSQRTMTLSGTVVGRERVDACGTVYEGWAVHAQRTIESVTTTLDNGAPDDASSTYDYVIAPQLGGIFLSQHRVASGKVGPLAYSFDAVEGIGTMTPAALPENER